MNSNHTTFHPSAFFLHPFPRAVSGSNPKRHIEFCMYRFALMQALFPCGC